jgi:hypothetical protein
VAYDLGPLIGWVMVSHIHWDTPLVTVKTVTGMDVSGHYGENPPLIDDAHPRSLMHYGL